MADGMDLSEIVKRTVQANAKFYKGWMDLSLDYFRGISEIFGGTPETSSPIMQEADLRAGVLVLEGEEGSTVRGAFLVTNDLGRNVACDLVASDFVNPGGARVIATATFEPAQFELAPGEQRVVQVAIPVDSKLAAGFGYTGEFAIKGMQGFSVPVVIRRLHKAGEWGDPHVESKDPAAPHGDPLEPFVSAPGIRDVSAVRPAAGKAQRKSAPSGKKSSRNKD
jgi:hypothetical protein